MNNALTMSALEVTAVLATADELSGLDAHTYRTLQTRRDALVAAAKGRQDEADSHVRALCRLLWSR